MWHKYNQACRYCYIKYWVCYKLTVDVKIYWITGDTTDSIGHSTDQWSVITAGHIDDSESTASISELNSLTGCNLRAAVQPAERRRGSRRRAGQTDRAELHQICAVGSYLYIGDWLCGWKTKYYSKHLIGKVSLTFCWHCVTKSLIQLCGSFLGRTLWWWLIRNF